MPFQAEALGSFFFGLPFFFLGLVLAAALGLPAGRALGAFMDLSKAFGGKTCRGWCQNKRYDRATYMHVNTSRPWAMDHIVQGNIHFGEGSILAQEIFGLLIPRATHIWPRMMDHGQFKQRIVQRCCYVDFLCKLVLFEHFQPSHVRLLFTAVSAWICSISLYACFMFFICVVMFEESLGRA